MKEILPLIIKKPTSQAKDFIGGLIAFLKEHSVLGLAIGVIVGQASKDLIDSIVGGFFMPFISLLIPTEGFENLVFQLDGVTFNFGLILKNLLVFLIVMVLLYVLIKRLLKRDDLIMKKK